MHIHRIVIAAVALSLNAATAFATPLTGSYSISEQYSPSNGGPGITNNLASPFNINLVAGTETSPANFFTTAPHGNCSGGGCSNHIETDTLTVTFSNLKILGVTIPTFMETALFTAKYSGSELSCAVGDGKSPSSGETDCIVWNGAPSTYNGSVTVFKSLGALDPTLAGDFLELFLYNATDWNITPRIGFELVTTPQIPVPEPASLGLMMGGLLGLGVLRRRRKLTAYLLLIGRPHREA